MMARIVCMGRVCMLRYGTASHPSSRLTTQYPPSVLDASLSHIPLPQKPSSNWRHFTTSLRNLSEGAESPPPPADVPKGILMGIGNPLLDITIEGDQAFLDKYHLEANNAIIAEPKHLPIFNDMMQNYSPVYCAGGATQNAIRIAQWILGRKSATTFMGCIGKDEPGEILQSYAKKDGVNVRYMQVERHPTGRCGAVITRGGQDRSLIAHLGAADYFTHMYLARPECFKYVERAQYFYIGGFVFPVCSQSIFDVANHACEHDKTMVMNLSAPFLCKYYADKSLDIIPLLDVLFGNGPEARMFGKLRGIKGESVQEIALATANLPKKNASRQRLVVFTQGRKEIVIAQGNHVETFPVKPVDKSTIKDTNACGDAFVGGFLSQIMQNKSIEDGVRCGMYAAQTIIKHWGCSYPKYHDFV